MSEKQPAEQTPKLGRHRIPLRMRLRSGWPFLVWAGAAVILLPLMLNDSSWQMGTRIHGIVGKETVVISPEETARVLALLVSPGETVTNGAPLVKMDTSSIDHELTEQLLDAYRTANSIRERRVDVQNTLAQRRARVLELEAQLAENRLTVSAEEAELARLVQEQALREQQFKAGLMNEIERDRQQPRIAELQQKVPLRKELTGMYEQQLAAARQLVEEATEASRAMAEEAQVVNVDAMLEQMQIDMEQYRDSYTLRSPCLGIVSDVLSEEGEVVRADSTVMRIIPKSLNTVVALVPEQISTLLQPGDRVWVSALNCRNDQRVNLPAMVESLSEEVRVEAALLSVGGRMIPMRSRRAMLRIENSANTELIAGEIVEVHRNNPVRGVRGWWQGLFRSGRDAS